MGTTGAVVMAVKACRGRRWSETLTHHAYSRARADFRHMNCDTTLEYQPGSRLARSDAAVQTVVDFMYGSDNTSTLSGAAPGWSWVADGWRSSKHATGSSPLDACGF